MKKKFWTIIIGVCMILFGYCIDAQALEIKSSNVPNNTYIIGKHMFTDKVVLTTKHIMLGATTIESDSLSEMIIYYKTPRGAWIDGLSGETITIPTNIDVDYIDMILQITNPTISSSKEVSDTNDSHGKIYNLILDKIEGVNGVELYSSTTETGEYKLVKDYKIEEINNNAIEVEVKGGYNYFYKIKTYKIESEKKYSEFSNVINIDNSLLQPGISPGYGGYIPAEGEDQTLNRILLFYKDAFVTALGNNPDGIELYSSLDKDGEYKLLRKITYEDLIVDEDGNIKIPFALIPAHTNYFKIRSYIEYSDETVYSEYRNATYVDSIQAPFIHKLQPLSVNDDEKTYPIELELSNVYKDYYNITPMGIEVYYSTEEDGEYTLLTKVSLSKMESLDLTGINNARKATVDMPVGGKYFVKVRNYVEVNGETLFGEYSNAQETEMYSITYNLDGGEYTYQEGKHYFNTYTKDSEISIASPKKDGYIFIGWTGSNGTTPQKEVTIEKGTTGNLEYTANWMLYGDVDGNETADIGDVTYILSYISNLYEFNDNQKLVADVNLDKEVDDVDVLILAKYFVDSSGYEITLPYDSGEKYTIKYNLSEGVLDERNITTYAQISLPYTLKAPEKEGYIFAGWTGSNGTTPQTEVTIEEGTTGNLEYTANWVLLGDVNNDGRINTEDTTLLRKYLAGFDIPETTNVLYGDVNKDSEIDDVDVAIIRKYATDNTGTIKLPYDSGEKYKITYNLNNGVTEYRNIETYAQISLPYTLENPTKEGYVFIGWTGSNGTTPQTEVTIEEGTTGNLEYVANWETAD